MSALYLTESGNHLVDDRMSDEMLAYMAHT